LASFEREIDHHIGRGDWASAAAAAGACRAAWPAASAGWLFGSILALLTEDRLTALALIDERLDKEPVDGQCLLQKAEVLLALGRRAEALAAAAAAAAAANATHIPAAHVATALDAIGEFLIQAGDPQQALLVYDRALAAAPADPTLRAKHADVNRILGHLVEAAADYEAVLAIVPTAAKALKGLVELRRQTPGRNLIAALQSALSAVPAGSADAAILNFGLAKAYEDLGEHAACWRHITAANALERSRLQYEPAIDRAAIDQVIAAFCDVETPRPDTTGARPIFIVGLPRSGTTLVERIIGSHSQVYSAGEITALSEAIDLALQRVSVSQPTDEHGPIEALRRLDGSQIAAEYLARTRALAGGRLRFTDKLLTNFLHCALILRAFPNARIVHVTRHPLAACYAIYRTRFAGTYPFAYDLNEIGDFYLGYRRLMAHWRDVLPGRILDVAYEDIVTRLEPTTRRMLAYLDLPFEAACLDFQSNPAPVKTTSAVQVRQPLYDRSLDLWRHHAAELAPLGARFEAAGISIDPARE
jgi:tetratricopeptide (TPR) repeat protein